MSTPSTARPGRRRLTPEARRADILDAARRLFAERPYATVSMGDVAEAAGVARSLVHHYFGSLHDLFLAIVEQAAVGLTDVRQAGPELALEERLRINVGATLDWVGENRETWLAVAGSGSDPELAAILEAARRRSVERMLAVNSDIVADTPTTRLALSGLHAYSEEVTRAWVMGETSREAAEAAILAALRSVLTEAIPALEAAAASGLA